MTDETDNLILEHLRGIRSDVARLDAKVDRLAAGQRLHSRALDMLRQDVRMVRTAVNHMARENVTPGEVETVHEDLNRMRADVDDLLVRVEVIEERHREH